MSQMKLMEAYARLKALREHLPPGHKIDVKFVEEFHSILTLLEESSGVSLASFRIPEREIHPATTKEVMHRPTRAIRTFTTEPYCELHVFLMKVDGVLTMFQLLTAAPGPGKATIGFNPGKGSQE